MTANDKALELKKHVGTIHSHNRLTLVQRKIANALLFNAYDELLTKEEHQIHIQALCELIGYDSKDFKSIKKALMALISTVIEWNLIDKDQLEGGNIWNASAIIADASIHGPICSYSYSKKMRQLLHRPELYGRINMRMQACFKSNYGLALYENCIRYQNIKQTPWFDMCIFRKLMGVEDGKYNIFRDFKRRVLDKGIAEVNEYSPIFITPTLRKQAGKVIALQFSIQRSEKSFVAERTTILSSNCKLTDRLQIDFGFSKNQIDKVLSCYDEQYILEKITIIESSSSFQSGKIINLSKYLQSALEQDFKSPKSSRERLGIIQGKREQAIQLRKLHEKYHDQFRRYQDQKILQHYQLLSSKQKNQLEKQFENYIKGSLHHTLYLRDGLTNILVTDRFCEFVRLHRNDLLGNLLTLEDFVKLNSISENQRLDENET